MSRIGKAPVEIPAGVTVKVENNVVKVKGPKGELSQEIHSDLTVAVDGNHVVVTRPSDDPEHRAHHGLVRALIHNMVVGVSEGYKKEMELVGVGYRAAANGQQEVGFWETWFDYQVSFFFVKQPISILFIHSLSISVSFSIYGLSIY